MSVSTEREQELRELFYAETNEPETEEWRESLSPEEQKMVEKWDELFDMGLSALCSSFPAAGVKETSPQQSVPAKISQKPKRHNTPVR